MLEIKVVALAGGIGGAKLVDGLSRILPSDSLTVIVNTGDDFDHLGLRICPDLDTVCYTLAGLANVTTGWGRIAETWNALQALLNWEDQPGFGWVIAIWVTTWRERGCSQKAIH